MTMTCFFTLYDISIIKIIVLSGSCYFMIICIHIYPHICYGLYIGYRNIVSLHFCIMICVLYVIKGQFLCPRKRALQAWAKSWQIQHTKKSLFCLFDYWSRQALALVSCHLHLIKAMTLADPTDPYLSQGAKSETLIVVERAAPAAFQGTLEQCHRWLFQVLTPPSW